MYNNPFSQIDYSLSEDIPNTSVPQMQNGRQKGWYLVIRVNSPEQFMSHAKYGGPYPDQQMARQAKRKGLNGDAPDLRSYRTKAWDGQKWTNNIREFSEINEERTLNDNAASLIERATGLCMEIWYSLTHHFHGSGDKYDPEAVNPSDKFMYFKLAPGGDARDDAYRKIIDATESLADKLNNALGRGGLFTPEVVRKDGHLECRVKYAEGQGGIFYAKSKDQDVGIGITLTMPRQGIIRDAFKSLVTTPNFPIGDDIPEPESVVPDAPSAQETPQQDKPTLGDLGGVNVVGKAPKELDAPTQLKQFDRREDVKLSSDDTINEFIGGRRGGGDSPQGGSGWYVVFGSYYSGGNWEPVSGPFDSSEQALDAIDDSDEVEQFNRDNPNRLYGDHYKVRYWNQPTGKWHKYQPKSFFTTKQGERSRPDMPDTSDAPLSSNEFDEPQNDNIPVDTSPFDNRNIQRPTSQPFRVTTRRNEEVAANSISAGTINSGKGKESGDPYSDTRDAIKKRNATQKANTTKLWKRAAEENENDYNFTLTNGPF